MHKLAKQMNQSLAIGFLSQMLIKSLLPLPYLPESSSSPLIKSSSASKPSNNDNNIDDIKHL